MSQLNVTALKHESAGVDNITLDANGRVGVGTSNPSLPLHIFAPSENVALFQRNGASPALVRFRDNTTTTDPYIAAYGNDLAFGLYGGGERMRIDSAGRVTLPYQPCFHAYALAQVDYNDVVRYNAAAVNRGGHYNASSYRFTAPVAGAYLFTFSIGRADPTSGTNNDRGIRFRVNGTDIYAYNPAQNSSVGIYHNHSFTVIRELNAGDFVDIATVTGSGRYTTSGNFFCGHLLG